MKKIIYLFALVFAAALVFGCLGNGDDPTPVGDYTLNVEPRSVRDGGVATVDLSIRNSFERSIRNVDIEMVGLPSAYQDDTHNMDIAEIMPGQEYPMIMTISTPGDLRTEQRLNPNIEVCFDYETDFFFDSSFIPAGSTEQVSLDRGQTRGPITITTSGFDRIHRQDVTGSLSMQNNWIGEITRINKVEVYESLEGSSVELGYSRCSAGNVMQPGTTDCEILENRAAIRNGITATLSFRGIGFDFDGNRVGIDRAAGSIDVTYCYEIGVGSITVTP